MVPIYEYNSVMNNNYYYTKVIRNLATTYIITECMVGDRAQWNYMIPTIQNMCLDPYGVPFVSKL